LDVRRFLILGSSIARSVHVRFFLQLLRRQLTSRASVGGPLRG
jgi:hypothetical protein